MSDYQEQLNRGAKRTSRMVDECIDAAHALCAAGDFEASSKAWKLASIYCEAMAIGRSVEVRSDSGVVRPLSGDK